MRNLLPLLPALTLGLFLSLALVPEPAAGQNAAAGADAGLAVGLAAREAALQAEAPRYAPTQWQKAEAELEKASRRRNPADPVGAATWNARVAQAYQEAELQALRSLYLAGVRTTLLDADQARAGRHAPTTLARAQASLASAEAALAANRAEPEKAAEAIAAAERDARQALRLATLLGQVDTGDLSAEALLAEVDTLTSRLAEAGALPDDPVVGDPVATEALITATAELRNRAEVAERELAERERQVLSLEDELREMDLQLGGTSAERDRLLMAQEAERRQREKIAALDQLFTSTQGSVLRQGNDVVLRLTGLNFRPGGAELSGAAESILRKAQEAIALFPRAAITVEGHTDSVGSDVSNQRLSDARASAVAQRLTETLALPAGRIQPVGYGESRPIASNDNDAGRRMNRRIDVVISTEGG